MGDQEALRPVERCVQRLVADGVDHGEIARRFRRRPDFVERVIAFTAMPRTGVQRAMSPLRPVERRILKWRASGVAHAEIGHRFRRSADHIRRVEQLATYKLAR
jgi:hypothetical protein